MKKGFMLGVMLGAAAVVAYDAGNKAKCGIRNGKKMVKKKLDNIFE